MAELPLIALFAILIGSIILLIWSGDILVRGAAALASNLGIPALIIGLTIVAFGTSAPELVVGVQAVLQDASELAIGNVIGSNIANILLVLGLPAIIMAIPTNSPGVTRNTGVTIFATLVTIAILFIHQPLTRLQGGFLFSGIILYLIWMGGLAKAGAEDPALREMSEADEMEGMPTSNVRIWIYIIAGLIGLAVGGHYIVQSASGIATTFNVPQEVIGLTIVAIGTSLPELATVAVAAWRGETEVAIGNVLGSNIFNLFAVLGAAALAGPVNIPRSLLVFDVWVMLIAILALAALIMTRKPIGRKVGIVLFAGYILYMAAIARGML